MTSTFAVLSTFRRLLRGSAVNRRRAGLPRQGQATLESLESRLLLTNPLTAIPRLNSLAGAPVNVYLDFDGHTESDPSWTSNNGGNAIVTPVFDIDNDVTTFSDEELRQIEEIWYRVSEDFMPFQVNVTTVAPASINDFQSIRVLIGGNGSWRPGAGGVALLDSFSQPWSNTAFVFSELFTRPHDIASAATHEAGHTFGLNHHSVWNTDGSKAAEYSPGDARRAPIMGVGYYTERDVWDNGPGNVSVNQLQDDLAVMTRAQNQTFRFRTDDYGNTVQSATRLNVFSPDISVAGIIEQNNDVDMLQFDTNTGPISFSVEGLNMKTIYGDQNLTYGTNLDAVLRLYDASGQLIAEDNPTNSLFASLSLNVTAGTYYVAVSGTGEYGALGQYTLTGTVVPLPTSPTMLSPTGLIEEPVPLFEWSPGANAAYYELEVDNLTTGGTAFYVRNVVGTTHLAEYQFIQADYRARVRTVAADGSQSEWSNYVTFTIDIPAPVQPTITRPVGQIATSFPTFIWSDQPDATTHTLWVTNLDTGFRAIYRTNYQATTYQHFEPLRDGNYRAWVKSFNSVGESSPWSDPVDFSIDAPAPSTPRIVSPPGTTTNTSPRISWEYDNEAWKFDLWIDYRNGGIPQYVREQAIVGVNYYDLKDLPQGTFNAWVRAFNGNGEVGPWSSVRTFTIDVLPPERPDMTGPVSPGGAALTDLKPTFTWTAAARAVTYDLWVNNETTGQVQIVREQSVSGTSFTPLTSLTEGNYRAWVRGINSAGEVGIWSNPISFRIDQPAPVTPVFTAPTPNAAGVVTSSTPTFAWTGDEYSSYYEFQVDDLTLGQSRTIHIRNLSSNSYTVPADMRFREHVYRAWVRAFNSAGEGSAWSAEFRFRIDIPNPTTPQIINPGGTIRTRTPRFEWSHSSETVLYEILVRDLERQEEIVLRVTSFTVNPAGTVASYVLPDNQALRNGTYRFWIRGFNALGTASAWSASRTFAVSLAENSVLPDYGDVAGSGVNATVLTALSSVSRSANESSGNLEQRVVQDSESLPKPDASVNSVSMQSHQASAVESDVAREMSEESLLTSDAEDAAIEQVMAGLADPSVRLEASASAGDSADQSRSTTLPVKEQAIRAAAAFGLFPMALRRRRRDEADAN